MAAASCTSVAMGLGRTICNLFTPSVGIAERVATLRTTLSGKFPFSLAESLTITPWDSGGGSGTGAGLGLPEQIGMIILPVDGLLPFIGVVRPAMTVVLSVWLVWWLIDRYTPQAVM